MGPGLRSGFAAGKSVASVGLGQARGYASTAQPLFNNLVVNAPREFWPAFLLRWRCWLWG
jgi:hypothetical protein